MRPATRGDGGAGASISHAWAKGGVFAVKLTATDSAGVKASATKPVSIVGPVLPPGGGATADTTAPVGSRLSMQDGRFRITRRRTALSARRRVKWGTAFRFRLSEAATVRISIERAAIGRRRPALPAGPQPHPSPATVPPLVKTGGTIVRKNQPRGAGACALPDASGASAWGPACIGPLCAPWTSPPTAPASSAPASA